MSVAHAVEDDDFVGCWFPRQFENRARSCWPTDDLNNAGSGACVVVSRLDRELARLCHPPLSNGFVQLGLAASARRQPTVDHVCALTEPEAIPEGSCGGRGCEGADSCRGGKDADPDPARNPQ